MCVLAGSLGWWDPEAALTSENMGSFLAKSTTRVMAGVMILVNSLKASRSTLSPSEVGATGDWPIFSGCTVETEEAAECWSDQKDDQRSKIE